MDIHNRCAIPRNVWDHGCHEFVHPNHLFFSHSTSRLVSYVHYFVSSHNCVYSSNNTSPSSSHVRGGRFPCIKSTHKFMWINHRSNFLLTIDHIHQGIVHSHDVLGHPIVLIGLHLFHLMVQHIFCPKK
jgi:hypothetical protein